MLEIRGSKLTFRWFGKEREGGRRKSIALELGQWVMKAEPGYRTLEQARALVVELRSAKGADRAEIIRRVRAELAGKRIAGAVAPPAGGPTVAQVFSEFYALRIAGGERKRVRPEDLKYDFESCILPSVRDEDGVAFGAKPIISITEDDCRDIIVKMAKRDATVYAKRILGGMKQFFGWAARGPYLRLPDGRKQQSPCADLIPFELGCEDSKNDGEKSERYLSPEEIRAVWHVVAEPFKTVERRWKGNNFGQQTHRGLDQRTWLALRFLFVVPVRSHTLLLAEKIEIHWEEKYWAVPPSHLKSTTRQRRARKGQPVIIPLSGLAIEILHELVALSPIDSKYVCCSPRRKVGKDGKVVDKPLGPKALCQAMDGLFEQGRLSIPKVTPHDFRRSVRTIMSNKKLGITDRSTAERVLGHKVAGRVEGIYDCWEYEDEKREALDRWAAHLLDIVGKEPAPPATVSALRPPGR
jgi:integrase